MELVERLMEELPVTCEQAEGGAGLLLQLAQARLPHSDLVRVADSVVAISDLIGKAPRFVLPPEQQLRSRVSRWLGGLGGLAPLVVPFARLRLDKAMLELFVGVLLAFFGEQGGPEIESLLFTVWR